MSGKRFLFIIGRGLAATAGTIEVLEQALTAAAFDQPVSLLFIDEGIDHLRRRSANRTEPQTALVGALPHYDIRAIHVESESLDAARLSVAELAIEVSRVARSELSALFGASDIVVAD